MSLDEAARHWLVARPIAHRGLHGIDGDRSRASVENSLAAAAAAIAKNYTIECDVQITQDGEAVVFHDETLDRLTSRTEKLCDLTAREITQISYRDGEGTIPRFADLLAAVAGRVALIVEVKSRFDGDTRLSERVLALVADYPGPLALQSFDPDVLIALRRSATRRPLGLIAQSDYSEAEWPGLAADTRRALSALSDYPRTRPDFLAWRLADLPNAATTLWREGMALPLLTWTVRSASEAEYAASFADQMIFEGFEP